MVNADLVLFPNLKYFDCSNTKQCWCKGMGFIYFFLSSYLKNFLRRSKKKLLTW